MRYFKFQIPTNADGSRVTYSPDYHGTMPRCPQNVKTILYNDKGGWGIAQTEDSFMPPEVEVLDEKTALALVAEAEDEEGVFFAQKLVDRWKPEEIVESEEDKAVLNG